MSVAATKTAGDLLIDAADRWMAHVSACPLAECGTCDVAVNRFRLAHKVWQSSAYKAADRPGSMATIAAERDAIDLRLRKLEVLVGGADLEARILTLIADQQFAWIAHGKLLTEVDKLQARLAAAERRA